VTDRRRPASPAGNGAQRRIVCLGDVMIDIVAELPGPLALGSDVHAPIRYLPGGSAANTAAWLANSGAAVSLIGRVGDDTMGRQAHADLAESGTTDRLQNDPSLPTGTCIVLVTPGGERTMVPDPGANAALRAEEFDESDFGPDAHLHVSGYALLGGARPAALAALTMARRAGMTVSIDAASAAPLAAAGARPFLEWIGSELLLFANAAEARVLTGHDDPPRAASILAQQFGFAVVKVAANGAYWSDGIGAAIHGPGSPVDVVDTTGAGDAFAAAFLHAVGAGLGVQRALDQANASAAVACTRLGGRPPRPAREG
jgi:sugar/nucleoside kinase (ribokinase family)